MTRLLALAAGIGALTILGNASRAETCTWIGFTTSWCNPANWTCGHVPGPDDDVVIPSVQLIGGALVEIDCDATINSLTVCTGRTVQFKGGYTLTIDDGLLNVNGGGTVKVNNVGTIVLQAAGSNHSIAGQLLLFGAGLIDVQSSMTFSGNGKIVGADAQITIASGATLTSTMASAAGGIRGYIKIGGGGAFDNRGRVEAFGGVFEFTSGLAAVNDASGSNRWVVASDSGSELKFSVATTSLNGGLVLNNRLTVNQNVKTCGQLTYNAGASIDVDAANSKVFKYLSYDAGSTCSGGNPKDSGGGTDCANDPFVVSRDKACP